MVCTWCNMADGRRRGWYAPGVTWLMAGGQYGMHLTQHGRWLEKKKVCTWYIMADGWRRGSFAPGIPADGWRWLGAR